MLAAGGPYPLVVPPVGGEYWLEGINHRVTSNSDFRSVDCKIETNNIIQSYRRDFIGKVQLHVIRFIIKASNFWGNHYIQLFTFKPLIL